ncbi:hypothetical protein [Clostridium transplantifaecale]|uniref:hypothetical protein n=1 Tax=Clostridium transplantifaecale TaxID=2479838 RepID=UPI000F632364|nr:hypothetical protein [Clostridium transplantifaecale]
MSKNKAAKALKAKKFQTGEIRAGKIQADEIQTDKIPKDKIQAGKIRTEETRMNIPHAKVSRAGEVPMEQAGYGILEEYKTLRDEIQSYIDASNQIYMFIFTAVSAIYLLAYYNHDASFYMITFLVLLLTKCRLIFYHESLIRIGEYIGSCIEPKVPGLNWETKTRGLEYEVTEKSVSYLLAELHYFSYTIMSLVTVVILWESGEWREYEKCSRFMMWGAIGITTLIIIILDFGMRFRTFRVRENYRKKWEERHDKTEEPNAVEPETGR